MKDIWTGICISTFPSLVENFGYYSYSYPYTVNAVNAVILRQN